MPERQYDLVLFGATGFTGALAAEYIAKNAPTNLKWAIAGRSESKLQNTKGEVEKRGGDRREVETMTVQLDSQEELQKMAESTTVLINTVGPYCRYGTPVVEACVKAGTHYVDCTGEHPWVKEMITKYHDLARKNGAIIIPECAIESAPADLVGYILSKTIRDELNVKTSDVRLSLCETKSQASGGTIETVLSILEIYSLRQMVAASKPLALSPVQKKYTAPRMSGVFTDPQLGVLTKSPNSIADRAIAMRSWGLFASEGEIKDNYGDKFTFEEYVEVRSSAVGWALYVALALGSLGLVFPPIRWLARKFVTQPGSGPSLERQQRGSMGWKSTGTVDDGSKRKASCDFRFAKGDAYVFTALLIVEAALAILYDSEGSLAQKMKGGVLTPASLGDGYVKRLEKAGVEINSRLL